MRNVDLIIKVLQKEINTIGTRHNSIVDQINEWKSETVITQEMYNDYLDALYGDVLVAGYSMPTSRVLKEMDPIAYNCGFSDYESSVERELSIL